MPRFIKHPGKKKPSFILIPAVAVLFLSGLLYFLFAGGLKKSEKAVEQATTGWEQSSSVLPDPPAPAAVFEPPSREGVLSIPPQPEQDPCLEAGNRLTRFFSQLDQRAYVASRRLEGGSELHFAGLLSKLYANPPVVTRETDNLTSLARNTVHFYRVLGKNNLFLIKEILEQESEIIEITLADFHRWSLTSPGCLPGEYAISLPLTDLYEYAGYFLNTLGGQSYLFRRTPRIRTLTKYYSVLILDQANEQNFNRHGLDIRPSIDSLLGEMEALRNLTGREKYLAVLQELKIKYHLRYGAR